MVGFFEFIVNFFNNIGTIILMLIESLLTAITVLMSAVGVPFVFTPYVPTIIATSMICVISLCVIKFLLGR